VSGCREAGSSKPTAFAIGCDEVKGGLAFEQVGDACLLEECKEFVAAAHSDMLAGVELSAGVVTVCKGSCPST
jgi:hypothetical protein